MKFPEHASVQNPVEDTIVRVSTGNLVVKDARPPDQNAAVLASFLGWTLDAFDYFLVVYCLTAIGKEFHRSDAQMALAITVTLVFRPAGAFLFGLLADRYGRRGPLTIVLVFYSVVEVATGFSTSYTSFLILRALFGIGMGGEWGVGASMAMEKVSPKFRGLISGVLQQGYALGNLLAALCFYLSVRSLGMAADVFPRGPACFTRDLRPDARQRIGSLGENEESGLARTPRFDPFQLEAVPVSRCC